MPANPLATGTGWEVGSRRARSNSAAMSWPDLEENTRYPGRERAGDGAREEKTNGVAMGIGHSDSRAVGFAAGYGDEYTSSPR